MSRSVVYGRGVGSSVSTSTIDDILKEDYVINNIKDTVNMSTYFLSQLKARKTTAGKRFIFPVRFGVGEGQGMRAELEQLPDPGYGQYDQASGNVTSQYGRFRITGQALHATSRAAFTNSLRSAIKNVRDGFQLETYQRTWGEQKGVIALVNGAVTVAAAGDTDDVSFDSPYGLDTYEGAGNSQSDRITRFPYFRKGMKLVFGTFGTGANATRFSPLNTGTITGIKSDGTLRVTFVTATNITDNASIVRGDALGTSASVTHPRSNINKSYMGVVEAVDADGTYLNIPREEEPGWQANELDAGSDELSEDMLQQAFDMAEVYGDGMTEEPGLVLSNHQTRRLYQAVITMQKRIVDVMTLEGGFSALSYNGKPWMKDKLTPPQHVYFLNMMDWCWFYMADVQWIDDDGNILHREDDVHAFKAAIYAMRQIACMKPANQTVLHDVDT